MQKIVPFPNRKTGMLLLHTVYVIQIFMFLYYCIANTWNWSKYEKVHKKFQGFWAFQFGDWRVSQSRKDTQQNSVMWWSLPRSNPHISQTLTTSAQVLFIWQFWYVLAKQATFRQLLWGRLSQKLCLPLFNGWTMHGKEIQTWRWKILTFL